LKFLNIQFQSLQEKKQSEERIYEFSFAMYYSGKYYAYIQVWKNNVSELPFQSNAGADYSNENTLSATWLMKPQKKWQDSIES